MVERCDRTAEVRGSNPLFSIGMYFRRGPFTVGLGAVVTLATLARPEALVTFTILILATDLGRSNRCPVTWALPWGKREH